MAKKRIFKSGDVFALKVDDSTYLAGRVLLNIEYDCLRSGIVDDSSLLKRCYNSVGPSFLIEMYKEILSEPRMPKNWECLYTGVNVSSRGAKEGHWIYIGNKNVDPMTIEFPEIIEMEIGKGYELTKGEISIPLNGDWGQIQEEKKVMHTLINSVGIKYYCLYQLGLKSMITAVYPKLNVETKFSKLTGDLRYTPDLRARVYEEIGEDPNQSYYEMALKHGYDLARFFK